MAIPRHHIAVKGDECQCGRKASLRHCPQCGSAQIRSRHNQEHTHMDGHVGWVKIQHVCNLCGHAFTPEERQWCTATPIGNAAAARKLQMLAEAEGNPSNTPEEQTAATVAKNIIEEFKKTGVVPSTEAEVKAFERAVRIAKSDAIQAYEEDQQFELACRQAYADDLYAYKTKNLGPHPDTEEDFVERLRAQHNRPKIEKPEE